MEQTVQNEKSAPFLYENRILINRIVIEYSSIELFKKYNFHP